MNPLHFNSLVEDTATSLFWRLVVPNQVYVLSPNTSIPQLLAQAAEFGFEVLLGEGDQGGMADNEFMVVVG